MVPFDQKRMAYDSVEMVAACPREMCQHRLSRRQICVNMSAS